MLWNIFLILPVGRLTRKRQLAPNCTLHRQFNRHELMIDRVLYFGKGSQTVATVLAFIVIPRIAYWNDQKCVFQCRRCWAYCLCAMLPRFTIWRSCLHVFNSLNLLLWCFLALHNAVATQICSIQNLREYFLAMFKTLSKKNPGFFCSFYQIITTCNNDCN